MKKKLVFPAIALAVLGVSLLGINAASADDVTSPHETIIQKLADKFGLNKDEVQKVFDEARDEHQAQMQTRFEERLAQAVKDGKITEAQKTLILNKHKEMQEEREKNMESWKNLTPDERKSQMETKRTKMQTWAKENGIDMQYFLGSGGFGPRGHFR
ncbi:MAG: hypothetical protein A2171_01475 [Candidatus Levybacteria bacterium RBG_13_35_9]|nr:MAG: hypothetical protein A2171_01475 [Candidatus Levybacteria bacterium RBG_13_35_9]